MSWLFNRVDEPEAYSTDTTVFDGTGAAPVAYTDLDCSSACGAVASIVLIAIENDSGANRNYNLRPNGYTRDSQGGIQQSNSVADGATGWMIIYTDSAGIIEWKSSANNVGQVVKVKAYINLT